MGNMVRWFGSRTLYFMAKQISATHSHIGVMCSRVGVEVEWVILFDRSPGKIKAYEVAFEWIRPTLSPYPTIEEGPVEWTGINTIFSHVELNRPVTFSFDQEDPMSDFARERTLEYKQMLFFIKNGFKHDDSTGFYTQKEVAKGFPKVFLNAHRNFEEYEILLKIIFTLVEHDEIDIEEVIDNVAETENKEALVILLQKAEELKVRRYMNTARWEL